MTDHIYRTRSHEYTITNTGRDLFQTARLQENYVAWEGVLWWNGSEFIGNVSLMTHFTKRQAIIWIENGCPATYPHFTLIWSSPDEVGKNVALQALYSRPEERMLPVHLSL